MCCLYILSVLNHIFCRGFSVTESIRTTCNTDSTTTSTWWLTMPSMLVGDVLCNNTVEFHCIHLKCALTHTKTNECLCPQGATTGLGVTLQLMQELVWSSRCKKVSLTAEWRSWSTSRLLSTETGGRVMLRVYKQTLNSQICKTYTEKSNGAASLNTECLSPAWCLVSLNAQCKNVDLTCIVLDWHFLTSF